MARLLSFLLFVAITIAISSVVLTLMSVILHVESIGTRLHTLSGDRVQRLS